MSHDLIGPFWTNDLPVTADAESDPQEAFFRVEFPGGSEASFAIATRCFYQMWFNGVWMGYGPARSSHGRLTIDRWELPAEHFRAENTVTVQAFWEGIFTFDHVRGTPGVWMALQQGGAVVSLRPLATVRTGRLATHRFSHQRGWVEEIDARQRARGWPRGPWIESEWQPAVIRTGDPSVTLEERDIRPFVKETRHAESVTFSGAADLRSRTEHRALGYERKPPFDAPRDNPSRNIQEEAICPSMAADENLAALTASGAGTAMLGPDPEGMDRTIQFDFGDNISGMLTLELEAPAGTQIDVGWSEANWDAELASRWSRSGQPGGSVAAREMCDARQGLRYICAGGRNERFEALFIMAMRHMRISFRRPPGNESQIFIHGLAVRIAGYPLPREGDFRCSDDSLNRIHRAAVETMRYSIHDVYMDCPGRERGGWLNDSYRAAIGMSAICEDAPFDRRFLRQFIDSMSVIPERRPVAPLYPSEFHRWNNGVQPPITCHSLYWLLQAERHLRLYGDQQLREEWRPALQAALDGLRVYRSAEGLIENVPWDDFLDWSRIENGPLRASNNFIYGLTLTRLGRLYGDAALTRDGQETLEVIERAAWNPGRELYADLVIRDGTTLKPGDRFGELTNYVALCSEAIPAEREETVWNQLRNFHSRTTDRPLQVYELDLSRCNAYGIIYRCDILDRRGEIGTLSRDLKEAYLPMIENGQTTLSEHLGRHFSLCHGFQGYIAHVLARSAGGIQLPGERGGIIRFRPQPALLSWSQTRVPWMGGHVQCWCSRLGDSECEVILSVPPGQRGELITGKQAPIEFYSTLHARVEF